MGSEGSMAHLSKVSLTLRRRQVGSPSGTEMVRRSRAFARGAGGVRILSVRSPNPLKDRCSHGPASDRRSRDRPQRSVCLRCLQRPPAPSRLGCPTRGVQGRPGPAPPGPEPLVVDRDRAVVRRHAAPRHGTPWGLARVRAAAPAGRPGARHPGPCGAGAQAAPPAGAAGGRDHRSGPGDLSVQCHARSRAGELLGARSRSR